MILMLLRVSVPAERLPTRRDHSRPILDALKTWLPA